MGVFKILSLLFLLCFEIHGTMAADKDLKFSFDGFAKGPSFNKSVALFGDSKLVNDSSWVQVTDSVSGSVGRVFYKKPINLFEGKKRNLISFSTYFSFSSVSNVTGDDVLAFVMVPSSLDLSLFGKKDNSSSALGFLLQYAKNETVVAFEFDISKTGNQARILIGRPESAEIRNLSFVGDLMMNNGGTLNCMIDYCVTSKRMVVRFRKSGTIKLMDPFFSFPVDLAKLWEDGQVSLGLSSANGNSSKAHFLHSWNFKTIHPPPMWMHSEPLEPKDITSVEMEVGGRSKCIWKMLGAMALGAVCGALGSMLAFYFLTICGVRRSVAVVPEECAIEQGKK